MIGQVVDVRRNRHEVRATIEIDANRKGVRLG